MAAKARAGSGGSQEVCMGLHVGSKGTSTWPPSSAVPDVEKSYIYWQQTWADSYMHPLWNESHKDGLAFLKWFNMQLALVSFSIQQNPWVFPGEPVPLPTICPRCQGTWEHERRKQGLSLLTASLRDVPASSFWEMLAQALVPEPTPAGMTPGCASHPQSLNYFRLYILLHCTFPPSVSAWKVYFPIEKPQQKRTSRS